MIVFSKSFYSLSLSAAMQLLQFSTKESVEEALQKCGHAKARLEGEILRFK
jgi:hypothetical protein